MKKLIPILIALIILIPSITFGSIDYKSGNITADNVLIQTRDAILGTVAFKPATLINLQTGYKKAVYSQNEANRYFSLGYVLDQKLLGFSVVTNYSTTLSSSITATQTTIPVGTTKDKKGEQLATSTLGMKIYLNIEPGGNKEELVVCTGISGDNWTGCTRGLAFSGADESAVSSYQYAHSAGSRVVMSNIHYVYQNFVDVDSNQTIGGNKTYTGTATFQGGVSNFSSIPTTSTTTPTLDEQLATKKYVDSSVIAGGVVGTETVPGIWEGATQAEMASGVATSTYSGIDYNLLLQSKYASSTSSATTTIPITGEDGKLDQSFIDLTEDFSFSGTTTFSGITSFSNIIDGTSFFGDGSDGDITISTTTVLTSDKYYDNLTIESGQTLNTAGYVVYIRGNLDNQGTITNSGNNAVGASAGAAIANKTLFGSAAGGNGGVIGNGYGGGGGGGGGIVMIFVNNVINEGNIFAKGGNGSNAVLDTNVNNDNSGNAGNNSANSIVQANGGKSGQRNAGGSQANGGVVSNLRVITERNPLRVSPMFDFVNSVAIGGGAGGGGGGLVYNQGSAGGGGGGGGIVVYFYKSITNTGSVLATGGIGGLGAGSGTAGENGSDGKIIKVKL